jgi:hypothetical protein
MTDAALLEAIAQALANLKLWIGREPDGDDTAQALAAIASMAGEPLDRVKAAYASSLTMQGAG